MIIFYHISYPNGLGADRWIYEGWRHAFEDLGHTVVTVTSREDIKREADLLQPDLLITYSSLWDFEIFLNQESRIMNYGKVTMFVDGEFLNNEVAVQLAKEGKLADIFFGERSVAMMPDFEKRTGHPYYVIANAADRRWHFPLRGSSGQAAAVEKYQCDIAYVGAYLPKKEAQFKKLLLPLTKKYHVRIYGPYWTWKDLILLTGNKICRNLRLTKLGNWLNTKRVTLPPEDENKLYSSAKICINFHEREADGRDYDLLNGRTFKIPASGGFEICDHVASLRKYFTEDEVVMAENDTDWFAKIDYYMRHDTGRRAIQERGTARALRDHTYHNRVEQLLKLIS